jgi:hypothetical protein
MRGSPVSRALEANSQRIFGLMPPTFGDRQLERPRLTVTVSLSEGDDSQSFRREPIMKTFILLLSLFVTAPAWAIPVAGNYMFLTGDLTISGSFTSTGSSLSDWSLSAPFGGVMRTFNSETDIRHFAGFPVPDPYLNNTSLFVTHKGATFFSGFDLFVVWNPDPAILNAGAAAIDPGHDPPLFDLPPQSFVATTQAVPLPDMFWPTALGFVGLAGWLAWRRGRERLS